MLNKEIKDTLKLSVGTILVFMITLIYSFLIIRLIVDKTFPIGEFIPLLIYITMMGIAFYLGISLFAEEKNERTFEYLFSLRYSRWKIMIYKIMPRIGAVLFFLGLYALLSLIMKPFPIPAGWLTTIFLYLSLFFSSAAMSLIHKNHITNIVYALAIYMFIYGIFVFTIIQLKGLAIMVGSGFITILAANIFVLSLLIFLAFMLDFRKADLSNMTTILFKKSGVSFSKFILLPLAALFILWIFLNRFDAGQNPDEFKLEDIPIADFNKNNGFYRLWTLIMPHQTDIESPEVIKKYQRLFDPGFDNDKFLKEWDHTSYRTMFRSYNKKWRKILKTDSHWIDEPRNAEEYRTWNQQILAKHNTIEKLKSEFSILLERYQKLINSEIFSDFTLPRYDSPIPNLLAWLRISKLFNIISMQMALEGDWENGISRVIDHINFFKKAIKGSRVLITNLIAKSNFRHSLQVLSSLLNHPQCPQTTYKSVLDRLTPIRYEEFGSAASFKIEYLTAVDYIDRIINSKDTGVLKKIGLTLFLQPNRTKYYIFTPYSEIINMEKQPPYQWSQGIEELKQKYTKKKRNWFWWVQNPGGKIIVEESIVSANMFSLMSKSFHLKTLYDMCRILAELRLYYQPGTPVRQILKGLESYKTVDPCSGKPYIWNNEKQILYSLGVDRDDDGGTYSYNTYYDTDYILPVILSPR